MHTHLGDRLANAISHGIGVLLSISGLIYLLFHAKTKIEIIAFIIYGSSLVFLYAASTIHHTIKMPTERGFYTLKSLDHIAIYVLIVGTFTPFVLLGTNYPSGKVLLIVLWIVAFIGITFKILWPRKWTVFHIILYLIMGWSIIILWSDLVTNTSGQITTYIVVGGILYTGGLPFFILSHVKEDWHYTHLLWHLCVLGGSIMHFLAVMNML
ncbi:MAG: hemolysin III family protein [Candidatus Izimaplasma sp.]|nr:hemolysin III family protein [Candidatus Izimaplasma bacterium]